MNPIEERKHEPWIEAMLAEALNSLMPCPFCGGSARLKYHRGEWGYSPAKISAQCSRCWCRAPLHDAEKWSDERGNYHDYPGAIVRAVKDWNMRVPAHTEAPSQMCQEEGCIQPIIRWEFTGGGDPRVTCALGHEHAYRM